VFLLSVIYPKIPSSHGYKNTNLTEVGTIPSKFSIYLHVQSKHCSILQADVWQSKFKFKSGASYPNVISNWSL